jgi:hypothetical protein
MKRLLDYIPDCFYAGRRSYSVPFIAVLVVAAAIILVALCWGL